MIKQKRLDNIINYILSNKTATLAELAELNDVSMDTVRNDLAELEKSNAMIKRVHGGAVCRNDDSRKQTFNVRNVSHKEQKTELAKLVDDIIIDGQAVAINNGTTNVEIAKRIARVFNHLTVITNSLSVAQVFAEFKSNNVIIPGGTLDPGEFCLYGTHCEQEIMSYNIDTAIIAVNAVSLDKGITDFRLHEEGIIKAMMKNADKTFVAADSSKFGNVSCINICSLNEIDAIITDSKLDDDIYNNFMETGVKIIRPALPQDLGK